MARRCLGAVGWAMCGCLLIVLLSGVLPVQAAPVPFVPNVKVVNTTTEPVPTLPQGVTKVAGILTLAAGATVAVANSPGAPLFVQLPAPNHHAFQQTVEMSIFGNARSASTSFVVPIGGTRLVIEEISVAATDTQTTLIGRVQTAVAGNIADHFLPAFPSLSVGSLGRPLTVVQARRIYADPGSVITVSYEIPPGLAPVPMTTQFWVTMSGFID